MRVFVLNAILGVMKKNVSTGAAKKQTAAKSSVSLNEEYGEIFNEMIYKIPLNMARRFVHCKRKELAEAGLATPDIF